MKTNTFATIAHRRLPVAVAGLLLLLIALPGMAAVKPAPGAVQSGMASFYHDSLHGNRTASGQVYDKNRVSAAHKTLPLGTKVKVTDLETGRSIVVPINDRGPFVRGRVIDLSRRAAAKLDMIKRGVTRVQIEVLSMPGSGA
ncbi:rare lipoprotein A [Thiorhodovibrio frisius]|uniref:Endolytic peptidoglycan transglycosylase RlpA n=2 Tax=Thiorhodovibrio frisius TaxID=631362 RepID=H8Z5Z7_9GAMM|nr:septal ring lytic transglycosylase RlpA family protein [Thiorhodovibrio frisius]EIC20647.1 rare lipoprotein A [Thiorhodovibrio frisius]WPL21395.1 RlpA-like protein precursor [Thiorhodovibrio frisius]